jgi:hypothetical protein
LFQLEFDSITDYDFDKPGISVDVELRLGDSSVSVPVKIDTGSEACIFAREFGERLGIDIEKGEIQTFSTVTGNFATYGHWVTMVMQGLEFDSYVFFAKDDFFIRSVLGRQGWLDRMIIGINDYEGKLYLKSHDNE